MFSWFLEQETLDKVRKSEQFQKIMEDLLRQIKQQKTTFGEDFEQVQKKYQGEVEEN